MQENKLTKEVIVYIAGTVAELFETPPQFGHAKALAQTYDESATAKKQALKKQVRLFAKHSGILPRSLKSELQPSGKLPRPQSALVPKA